MTFEQSRNVLNKATVFTYMAFILSLPFLGGKFHSSSLFYLACTLFLIVFFFQKSLRDKLFSQTEFNIGITLVAALLGWFSLSNLWSPDPENFFSTLKHSLYLLVFILLFRMSSLHGRKSIVLLMLFASTVAICTMVFIYSDKQNIFVNRMQTAFITQPSNIIDLGGYFGVAIICGLILIRETGKKWIFLPVALLFSGLLFTQSRGPLFSLLLACIPLLILLRRKHLGYLLIGMAAVVVVALIVLINNYDDTLIARIASTYRQSFTRIGIWQEAWNLFLQKPWFGWGFDKQLDFVNNIGEHVHTTHNLYFGTLLKGGAVGMALMFAVMGYALYMGWRQIKQNHALEASMIVFSLLFYASQGMFVLGNPGEPWVLFWFPLAVVFSLRTERQHGSRCL